MNKQQILNITGLTEKEFYSRYPDQESFCNDYPEACAKLGQAAEGIEVTNSLTSPEEIQKLGKAYGFRTDNNKNFQQDMYNYVAKNKPELFKESISKFGPANAGLTNYGSVQGYRPDAYIGPRVADMMGRLGTPQAPKQPTPSTRYVNLGYVNPQGVGDSVYNNASRQDKLSYDRGSVIKYGNKSDLENFDREMAARHPSDYSGIMNLNYQDPRTGQFRAYNTQAVTNQAPKPGQPAMPATFPGQQPVGGYAQNPAGGWNIGPAQAPSQPGMPARQQAPVQGGQPQMSHMGPWHTNAQGEYTRYYTNQQGDMNPGVTPGAALGQQAYGGMMAKGGAVNPPIYTADYDKIKSYQDSLNLYKAMQMQDKLMGPGSKPVNSDIKWTTDELKKGRVKKMVKGIDEPVADDFQSEKDQFEGGFNIFSSRKEDKKLLDYYKSLGFGPNQIMYHSSPDIVSDKIKAVGTYFDGTALSPIYKEPVQPYMLLRDDLNNIQSKGVGSEGEFIELPKRFKTTNQKVSLKEPEHFLDVSKPDGSGIQRIYFNSKKELEDFDKENAMLRTGSFSRAETYSKKAYGGEMIKRADGSYSKRGLWDNIRANKGSGKKPTKEMLEQEAKIKAEYAYGGFYDDGGEMAQGGNIEDYGGGMFAYGGIHLDPAKKGTFKAQATRMGMSVQQAASHILANKEDYSPAMVKKANFAKNFAKEFGGNVILNTNEKNLYIKQIGGEKHFDPTTIDSRFLVEPNYVAGLNSKGHYGYDGKGTINYNPNDEYENINNPIWLGHEKYHHYQTLSGKNPKERRQQELNDSINKMIKKSPELQFIPQQILTNGIYKGQNHIPGAEDLMYEDPSTLEGEARLYEDYINNGGKPMFKHGGYVGMDGKFHMAKGSGTFSGNAYYANGGEEDPNLTAPYDGSNPNAPLPPFDPSAYQAMQLPTGYVGYSKKDPATGQFVPIDNVRKDDLWKHLSGSQRWNTGQTVTQKVGRAAGDIGNFVNNAASVAGMYSNYKQMNDKNQEMNNYLQNNQTTIGIYGPSAQAAGKGNINVTGSNYGQQWNPQRMGQWSYSGMYNGPQYTAMAENGLEIKGVDAPILSRPGMDTPLGESALAFSSFAEPVNLKPNFTKQQYSQSLTNTYNPVGYNPSGADISTKLNNPTNMIYHPWMSKLGAQPSSIKQKDGNGVFAQFPDIDTALKAYETQLFGEVDGVFSSSHYNPNTTVDSALRKWSGNGYGGNIYPEIANKTLAQVTPAERRELAKRQIKNESNAMYSKLKRKGYFEMGGSYQDGGVVEMTDAEIKQFLEKGGQLEFLD